MWANCRPRSHIFRRGLRTAADEAASANRHGRLIWGRGGSSADVASWREGVCGSGNRMMCEKASGGSSVLVFQRDRMRAFRRWLCTTGISHDVAESCFAKLRGSRVRLVEVCARDGLQNEEEVVTVERKAELINALADSGLQSIEAGAFVNPKWVPQMAGTADVYARINRRPGVTYPALVPNIKGYLMAKECGVTEVAVFTGASEMFTKRNINCSIAESIQRFQPIFDAAKADGIRVRGYVSCVMGCPWEGKVSNSVVVDLTRRLLGSGCYEVSLGDTIGVGTSGDTARLMSALLSAGIPGEQLAVHFHDTYGQGLANVLTALQFGVRTVDSSAGGLGGCPFATGAAGNIATEDVLYMLMGLEMETGVDIHRVITAAENVCKILGRPIGSKSGFALSRNTRRNKTTATNCRPEIQG
eukprot:GHVQ01035865.1.p1 GENE.GHVQ01035865.1~~GHVQ01035865.1.p1  ORF type:complete len:416 (+),score=43.86 GHVQ01035865.1:1201-2448(+)